MIEIDNDKFYTKKEVSEVLGVTPLTLSTYSKKYKVFPMKLGKVCYYSEPQIREIIKARTDEANERNAQRVKS